MHHGRHRPLVADSALDARHPGDAADQESLLHEAADEGRIAGDNAGRYPDMVVRPRRAPLTVVFSDPQIASVGLTQAQAEERGIDFVSATKPYGEVAYGWAMEDAAHFVKLLADPTDGRLLGAHIVGPEASVLIQPLIQAMTFGLPARQMAHGQYWIHPSLSEVVENALLALPLARHLTE